MTALMERPATRRSGWRGPTEARPFPSLGWQWLDWGYRYLPSPSDPSRPLVLTDEQAAYIGVPKQGPYKPDTYRY